LRVEGDSRLMLAINALETGVHVRDSAILFGRITARQIVLDDQATVFARPSTGAFIGLTALEGPHRDHEGRLHDAVCAPDRTAPASMANLAEQLGITVVAAGVSVAPTPEIELDILVDPVAFDDSTGTLSAENHADADGLPWQNRRSRWLEERRQVDTAHRRMQATQRRWYRHDRRSR
ncbi:MAG: hypothetical protein MK085_10325, partial [Phycisphaerales bacterium]|nr:hypothetical protein [Phycisphaerales bacterium]